MIREGLIPVILGTAVTATGVAMRSVDMKNNGMSKRELGPMVAAGIIGFGVAHLLLGGIDLTQKR